ncbi:MAG: hypothetical protein JNN01_16075 [Opitutaceae bacterium]|nr:hypothetical protein [Opitutaceae bacterium]
MSPGDFLSYDTSGSCPRGLPLPSWAPAIAVTLLVFACRLPDPPRSMLSPSPGFHSGRFQSLQSGPPPSVFLLLYPNIKTNETPTS